MKVTSDRIRARAEQLRTHGFRIRTDMVRATLELNAGARTQLNNEGEAPPASSGSNNESHDPEQAA